MVKAEIKLQTFNNINIKEWFEISLKIVKRLKLIHLPLCNFGPSGRFVLFCWATGTLGPIQCVVVVNYPFHHGRNLAFCKVHTSRHFNFSGFSCQTTLTDGALEADVYILTGFAADGIISHKKRQENLKTRLQSYDRVDKTDFWLGPKSGLRIRS